MQPDTDIQYGGFHFAEPGWFILLLVIPFVLAAYRKFKGHAASHVDLERFADKHLLPHLLKNYGEDEKPARRALWFWSAAFALGIFAMAGPRWNYEDVKAFRPEQDLVILLDLSPTMDVQDVKPSRLARARQEIDDILTQNQGISIGLVAYAAVPHMISPLTDDMRTIGNLLPAIETSLVSIPGSNLKTALEMAADMLGHEQGNQKSILIVSDGNFSGSDAGALASIVPGASIYTMGVGTAEGAPLAHNGTWLKDKDGKMLMARLQAERLQALSAAGHGAYIPVDYTDGDTRALLAHIGSTADAALAQKKTRIWHERFYIPAIMAALLVLPWFRRGYVFPVLLFMTLLSAHAPVARADILDLFRNRAQQGQHAYEKGDYSRAGEMFDTPYRRGVAQYKAHQYDKAEQSFSRATGPDADYNRGNAQMMQKKPDEAVASYESALRQRPDDEAIKHNLEIARKMAEEKKKQQEQQKQQQQGKDSQKKDGQDQSGKGQQDQDQQNKQGDQKQQDGSQDQKNNKQQQPSESQQQQGKDQAGQQQDSAQKQDQAGDQKTGKEQKDQANQRQPGQNKPEQNQPGQQSSQPQQQGKDGQPQQNQPNKNQTPQNQNAANQSAQEHADQDQADKDRAGEDQTQQQQQPGEPKKTPGGTEAQDQQTQQQQGKQDQQPVQDPNQTVNKDQPPPSNTAQTPDTQSRDDRQPPDQNQDNNGQQTTGQPGGEKPDGKPVDARPQRSQKDIEADQWLNRVQNDPGTFLRNQFMIEDRRAQDAASKNGAQKEGD